MSEAAEPPRDLNRINLPAKPPSKEPDQRTTREEEKLRQRSQTPKPTEREAQARQEHVAALTAHLDHHQKECEGCRKEMKELRESLEASIQTLRLTLEAERKRSENLGNECVKLREISWSVGWMTMLGNSKVAVGSIALGVAGCWPGMIDPVKYSLGSVGGAVAICGVLLTFMGYKAGKRSQS